MEFTAFFVTWASYRSLCALHLITVWFHTSVVVLSSVLCGCAMHKKEWLMLKMSKVCSCHVSSCHGVLNLVGRTTCCRSGPTCRNFCIDSVQFWWSRNRFNVIRIACCSWVSLMAGYLSQMSLCVSQWRVTPTSWHRSVISSICNKRNDTILLIAPSFN